MKLLHTELGTILLPMTAADTGLRRRFNIGKSTIIPSTDYGGTLSKESGGHRKKKMLGKKKSASTYSMLCVQLKARKSRQLMIFLLTSMRSCQPTFGRSKKISKSIYDAMLDNTAKINMYNSSVI